MQVKMRRCITCNKHICTFWIAIIGRRDAVAEK